MVVVESVAMVLFVGHISFGSLGRQKQGKSVLVTNLGSLVLYATKVRRSLSAGVCSIFMVKGGRH